MTVVNKYHITPEVDDVNIMRPGPWGNKYVIGRDGTRAQCILKHKIDILKDFPLQSKIRKELRGKRLVCCCKPQACHGDILSDIANSPQLDLLD